MAEPEDGHLGEAHIAIEEGSTHAALWVGGLRQRDGRAQVAPDNQAHQAADDL